MNIPLYPFLSPAELYIMCCSRADGLWRITLKLIACGLWACCLADWPPPHPLLVSYFPRKVSLAAWQIRLLFAHSILSAKMLHNSLRICYCCCCCWGMIESLSSHLSDMYWKGKMTNKKGPGTVSSTPDLQTLELNAFRSVLLPP